VRRREYCYLGPRERQEIMDQPGDGDMEVPAPEQFAYTLVVLGM
jgi:hypothetical protein